jgi:hypothetical protein
MTGHVPSDLRDVAALVLPPIRFHDRRNILAVLAGSEPETR